MALLERLVACDTRNPPRAIDAGGIFEVLAAALGPGFSIAVTDLGEGCVSLLATRGAPSLVFNVHVDTVPADAGWARDPLRLEVDGDRAIGLGACDVKGAAACLVVAAREARGDAALLFTSDEEAGQSRCVRHFLDARPALRGAVIAEPTSCRAVVEHRGIASCLGEFRGTAGHASAARALEDSALHEAVRWAARALALAGEREARRYKDLAGIRFNLGVLQGGTKANMIASSAALRFGARPLPDQRPEDLIAELTALAPRPDRVAWQTTFLAPPLPAPLPGAAVGARVDEALALARELGLPAGAPVDFWTEAALFSAAGIPSIVYGPGSITLAHAPGEWVALSDLAEATSTYQRLLARP
ncbi:MAG: acetylornithine deacetylase [Polyangiaceae bacterium]|nr:acetylornithine deacetylase [Polyangiaceae bacterium]